MKFLSHAREQARICRNEISASSEILLERIQEYLWKQYKIEMNPVHRSAIEDGRAEIRPDENCLLYDERLNETPDEKLFIIAHELGHLKLHGRLTRRTSEVDPVYGSMYWNGGISSLTRYSRRSKEEAEANAFAAEFLAPCADVVTQWKSDIRMNPRSLADRLQAPLRVVRMQLAEGIYHEVFSSEPVGEPVQEKMFNCNDSQETAARFIGAPALVNAGPGTGKTATLVRRVEFLLQEQRASPESILVLTFSNDAAAELEERISRRFGSSIASRVDISTFHGFGLSFLQHHGQLSNFDASVCVLDEAAQAEIVAEVLGSVYCIPIINLSRPDETVKEIVRHIGYLKDRLCSPDDFEKSIAEWVTEPGAQPDKDAQKAPSISFLEVYRAYEQACSARRRVDFADLISKPIEILNEQPELKQKYREKYKWVLVDEYQDVSRATAILLQHLCGPVNPPWVVGDKRQSIFRFRGAAPENVDEFTRDFPGAAQFSLNINYRSCAEVVSVANRLAGLMEAAETIGETQWSAFETNPNAIGSEAIKIAVADSDQAEYAGIAAQVQEWLEDGVPAQDVVVLARRNLDVRNIALALGGQGVRTAVSGLLTAEGSAGDLAALATLVDRPIASLPRLAYALGRNRFSAAIINSVIQRLRPAFEKEVRQIVTPAEDQHPLEAEIHRAMECLQNEADAGDAFSIYCAFLFDGSDYLRRILDQSESAERTLALSEIVASLSRAAAYRFSHLGVTPSVSRKGFAKHFRESLSASSPCLMPTRPSADAVRVMTCHSSKGLEFPCVIVSGQTLSRASGQYEWLPPMLQPAEADDLEQANSLLFVGATRAQQALMVSYAATSSGLAKARPRTPTLLFSKWLETLGESPVSLPSWPLSKVNAEMGAVWGGALKRPLAARNLDSSRCSLNTYLQDYAGGKFPINEDPLYPAFYVTVRLVMQRIVEHAHLREGPIRVDEARSIFYENWAKLQASDHSHHTLYFKLALSYVEKFAQAFSPEKGAFESSNHILQNGSPLSLSLDLVALFRTSHAPWTAIMFRPESLREKHRDKGLLWGALKTQHRATFVLLRKSFPDLRPMVFSGGDGALYSYQWSNRKNDFETETNRLFERSDQFAKGLFSEQIEPFTCDNRCESRVSCPYWMNAI